MSQIPPGIVGEPYKQYVKDQIRIRQQISAAGFDGRERTSEEVAYLTTKNAWVKCASSVSIQETSDRLKKLNISDASLLGSGLAKKYVLFNGISDYNDITYRRFGISSNTDVISEALYGFGGQDFGQRPMPGITSFRISHNNIGTLRTAQLKLVANNRTQFDILETLYVRLGYTIFVEWGNNMYFDETESTDGSVSRKLKYSGTDAVTLIDDGTWFKEQKEHPTTDIEFFNKIEARRKEFSGNYDAFFGKIVNFDWTFTTEGTYEITLDLRSLGDVVESFKVNALSPSGNIETKKDGDTNIQTSANRGDILNQLYCLRKDEEGRLWNQNINDNIPFVKTTAYEDNDSSSTPLESYYIKFSEFLSVIENLLPHKKQEGSNTSEPMIKISTDRDNYMRLFPGLNSTNPSVCVIRNETLIEISDGVIGKDPLNAKSFEVFDISSLEIDKVVRGRIMDIYLHLPFVETSLENLTNLSEDGDVTLFKYIKTITTEINKCFGGYVSLEPTLQDDLTLVIKDLNLETRVKKDGSVENLKDDDKDGIINVFGYNQSEKESNFVRNFSFNTNISNRLAAQISIGAARGNQTTKNISGFFENLNRGLYDRYQKEVFDTKDVKDADYEESKLLLGCKVDKDKKSNPVGLGQAFAVSNARGTRTPGDIVTESSEPAKKEEQSDLQKAEDTFSEAQKAYLEYLVDCFGISGKVSSPRYFLKKEKDAQRGDATLRSYIGARINLLQQKAKEKGEYYSGDIIGFIPINATLEIEGLSGIKIYNLLSIESEFLPLNYPDIVDLIIVGVSHVLENNDWVTELVAQTKPNSGEPKGSDLDQLEKTADTSQEDILSEDIAGDLEDRLELFAPTGDLPFEIREDSGGSGFFGAARAGNTEDTFIRGRTHGGVDIVTQVPDSSDIDIFREYPYLKGRKEIYKQYTNSTDLATRTLARAVVDGLNPTSGRGTTIFAPITGRLVFTTAGRKSVLPGAKILGTGEFTGYIVFIFYFAPDKNLQGKIVKKGQPIGNAIDLSLQPNYQQSGVTDHIHFEIRTTKGLKPKKLNPNDFDYTITP